MKLILFITLFSLTCLDILGQQNIFPDTMPIKTGYSVLTKYSNCLECKPKTTNQITNKWHFDKSGRNTSKRFFCSSKPCGLQTNNYKNGKLISYENYNTQVSTGIEYQMAWDSTILTNQVKYEYENLRLSKIIWVNGQDNRISFEITYSYNQEGFLTKEVVKNFPNPNFLGTFEPNSTEFKEGSDARSFYLNYKDYSYSDNTISIKYYKKDSLTATETRKNNENGKLLQSELLDANGKLLKEVTYSYDTNGELTAQKTTENGYDGYGNPYDFHGYDKVTFSNDPNGHITEKRSFRSGQLVLIENYKSSK